MKQNIEEILQKYIECTARKLLEQQIHSPGFKLDSVKRDGSGLIGDIVKEVNGTFEFSNSTKILNWWKRDNHAFKTRVLSRIEELKKTDDTKMDVSSKPETSSEIEMDEDDDFKETGTKVDFKSFILLKQFVYIKKCQRIQIERKLNLI